MFECPSCGAPVSTPSVPKLTQSPLEQLEFERVRRSFKSSYNKHIVIGSITLAFGVIVTLLSVLSFAETGHAVIALGAIGVGLADLIYGLVNR